MFLCDKDPKTLIVSFVEALEVLANKSKSEKQTKFASIQEIIKSRVKTIFEKLNERKGHTPPAFDFEDECIEDEKETDMSTQILKIQKNWTCNNTWSVISTHYLYLDSTVESTI